MLRQRVVQRTVKRERSRQRMQWGLIGQQTLLTLRERGKRMTLARDDASRRWRTESELELELELTRSPVRAHQPRQPHDTRTDHLRIRSYHQYEPSDRLETLANGRGHVQRGSRLDRTSPTSADHVLAVFPAPFLRLVCRARPSQRVGRPPRLEMPSPPGLDRRMSSYRGDTLSVPGSSSPSRANVSSTTPPSLARALPLHSCLPCPFHPQARPYPSPTPSPPPQPFPSLPDDTPPPSAHAQLSSSPRTKQTPLQIPLPANLNSFDSPSGFSTSSSPGQPPYQHHLAHHASFTSAYSNFDESPFLPPSSSFPLPSAFSRQEPSSPTSSTTSSRSSLEGGPRRRHRPPAAYSSLPPSPTRAFATSIDLPTLDLELLRRKFGGSEGNQVELEPESPPLARPRKEDETAAPSTLWEALQEEIWANDFDSHQEMKCESPTLFTG